MPESDKTPSEIVNDLINKVERMKRELKAEKSKNLNSLRKLMIGARIRVARLSMGLGQIEFGEKLKTSQNTISEWEKGNVEPKQTTIIKISEVTGIDWQWFYKE